MTASQFLRHHAALLALLVCSAFASAAWADKPEWANEATRQGRGDSNRGYERHEGREYERRGNPSAQKHAYNREIRQGHYFDDRQRLVIRNYYGEQFRHGHCPPGLARRHNGCLPPGQAKKYTVGRNLPSAVVYYPVPQTVIVKLGAAPAGYKYVRVASDILLIAVGTRLVVDAIEDLSRF